MSEQEYLDESVQLMGELNRQIERRRRTQETLDWMREMVRLSEGGKPKVRVLTPENVHAHYDAKWREQQRRERREAGGISLM